MRGSKNWGPCGRAAAEHLAAARPLHRTINMRPLNEVRKKICCNSGKTIIEKGSVLIQGSVIYYYTWAAR